MTATGFKKQALDASLLSITATTSAGASSTSSSTIGDITSASQSITTFGRCNIYVVATVQAYSNPGTVVEYFIQLTDGSNVAIGNQQQWSLMPGNRRVQIVAKAIVVNAAAGTYTYKIRHKNGDNTTSCTAEATQLDIIALPS